MQNDSVDPNRMGIQPCVSDEANLLHTPAILFHPTAHTGLGTAAVSIRVGEIAKAQKAPARRRIAVAPVDRRDRSEECRPFGILAEVFTSALVAEDEERLAVGFDFASEFLDVTTKQSFVGPAAKMILLCHT